METHTNYLIYFIIAVVLHQVPIIYVTCYFGISLFYLSLFFLGQHPGGGSFASPGAATRTVAIPLILWSRD